MRRPIPIVLADDLTGAAEVAAIAHQAGLRAVVLTGPAAGPVDADVLVLDTDTRLAPRATVARRVQAATRRLNRVPHARFFLKVDSVLRGPVLTQLAACARALGCRRTLLVPANPSLGRIIRQGRYLVDGRPLHATAFARDPHHPRTTDDVLRLLGRAPRLPVALVAPTAGRLPRTGVLVGECTSAADLARWAGRVDRATLPAGGADFFRAWLQRIFGGARAASAYSPPTGAALLLHGTTAAPASAGARRFRGRRPPSVATVTALLRRHGAAAVGAADSTLHDPGAPAAIARGFADLARRLHAAGEFRHLLIAGGATAATVLHALGWTTLEVARVWGPGVVTLRPVSDRGFAVTLKPGSYPWPASLRHVLLTPLLT